jgi:aspartate-semialdehyde dehydrogenase
MEKIDIAVVGATGLVGSELIAMLAARKFPAGRVRLFASWNTAGEGLEFQGEELKVEPIKADFYEGADVVFFCAPAMVGRDLAEEAVKKGKVVIDASPAFRLKPEAVLAVPEVNPQALPDPGQSALVVSPSSLSVAAALVAAPIRRKFGLTRAVVTAAFGSTALGRGGFEEHEQQTVGLFNQKDAVIERFVRQSAFNIFPRVGAFIDSDTEAERELMDELPRVLGAPLPIAVTCMQAPVFCGLAAAVNLELEKETTADAVREALRDAPGVALIDDPAKEEFPDTVSAMTREEISVGRVRRDPSHPRGVQLWISADNLRKGSALNMIHIAEAIWED